MTETNHPLPHPRVQALASSMLRFLATLGGFTPFAAIYKHYWPNKATEDLGALGTAALAASLVFSISALYRKFWNRRLLQFFGMSSLTRPIIALPSWVPRQDQTLGKYNYDTNLFETRKTRTGPGTSQENIDTLMRTIHIEPVFERMRPFYRLDEALWLTSHKEPLFLHQRPETIGMENVSVVSYGASSSNQLCRFVLSQPPLHSDPHVYHFLSEINQEGEADYFLGRLSTSRPPYDGLLSRYDETDKFEYALLIKFTLHRSFDNDQRRKKVTMFVCAGTDRFGSEATLRHLLEHWHHLRKENGLRDFYYLFKVSQESTAIEGTALLHGTRAPGSPRFTFSRPATRQE